MLESRDEEKEEKEKDGKRGKNPSNSHFVALKFEEKEGKSVGWCKNYGNSCTVWSEAVEIFKRIRKGQGWQVLLFADDWNEEISEAIRCFVFVTVGIFHPCVSYESGVDLWWIMMYCRDFISWTLAFGIIRISIVLIQYVSIWELLFRLGKLNKLGF